MDLHPLIDGGAQERNRRAGTENVAGIVARGKVCQLTQSSLVAESQRIGALRDRLKQDIVLSIPDVQVNEVRDRRVPNTTDISFMGVPADSLLVNLDLAGIAVSSGAACSSGTVRPSHVLAAMALGPA